MGTKILNDIYNDLKLLISTITTFEEDEDGFQICERFALSNIKHHKYLSVNSHMTKKAINEIAMKFTIHGKYEVAKKFNELIKLFLTSFDFDHHPQYDLQWSLLTLLLDLSTETHKSELSTLKVSRAVCSINTTTDINEDDIDWVYYLKEGQENFFCDYKSDSESEWSDNEDVEVPELSLSIPAQNNFILDNSQSAKTLSAINKLSQALTKEIESRNWLLSNVQHTWWNELELHKHQVNNQCVDIRLCEIWHSLKNLNTISTISEYQVCRELLWMFHVSTEMVVFQQREKLEFFIRPNISTPSLTTVAFNNILSPFCEYFSMIYNIEQFSNELHPKHNSMCEQQMPPFTYEVYNKALQQHLFKYRDEIVNVEKHIMKQDSCNTFLSLSTTLKMHLNGIRTLYEVHQKAVSNWKISSNWKCASQLLSKLYFEMQNSHSREKTNICADLYLSSLTVYLNIIDTWLSEGRLEDWRDEFIIAKAIDDKTGTKQHEVFIVRALHNICLTDPIMQFLVHKVQHIGHNIELLVSLDRIVDMWKSTAENNDTRISLREEFYSKLVFEISKYSFPEPIKEIYKFEAQMESSQENDMDTEKNIIDQISALQNPFLLKALKEYMPSELYKKEANDENILNTCNIKMPKHNLFERLEEVSLYILPFRKILENTLSSTLHSRYSSATKLVKNIMTCEYKLESHLKLMRSVYMMEAGHVMSKLYQILFSEIESNQIWSNSYFLSCILEEIFSQEWPDASSRWSITVQDVNTHLVPQAVESITLHYAVDWPINIVLNKDTLNKYNKIFRFQLKLKWALWTLNNLRFKDLEGSKLSYMKHKLEHFQIRRLESLRFWLLHAIGSIHAYLSGQVLQNLGLILDKYLARADSLDEIITVHNEYLDKVHEHCLLTADFEDIMITINNLIDMCVHVRDYWNRRKLLLATTELAVMEHSYIKYHTYLALALHNAIQHKDADYLTGLSSAFNCSMPCT